jgi:hypothetical protein
MGKYARVTVISRVTVIWRNARHLQVQPTLHQIMSVKCTVTDFLWNPSRVIPYQAGEWLTQLRNVTVNHEKNLSF